jgi:NADH:ubiquinone oxidoreductase subunit K
MHLLWIFFVYVIILFVIGFYCLLATLNLVRALIGIEILMKAVTLLIIIAGYASGRTSLSQSLVITLIVVETVLIAVAMGIVLSVYKHTKSLDTKNVTNLKG